MKIFKCYTEKDKKWTDLSLLGHEPTFKSTMFFFIKPSDFFTSKQIVRTNMRFIYIYESSGSLKLSYFPEV